MKTVIACKGLALTYGTDYKAHVVVQQGTFWKWDGLLREKIRIYREGITLEITRTEFLRYFHERSSDELPEIADENE